MDKLEKLAAETKFTVYSRRATLIVSGIATILIICFLSLFAAVVVVKLQSCSTSEEAQVQALKAAKEQVCWQPGCLSAAETAVEAMDISVDPCEDFYTYACGGWMKQNVAPPDRSGVSMDTQLSIDNNDKIRKLLEQRWTWHPNPVTNTIKRFFRLCLHDYARTKKGGQDMVMIIRDKLKSWLLMDNSSWSSQFNLEDALESAHHDYMVPLLYTYDVWPDFRNTENSIISILPAKVGMSYNNFVRRNNKTRVLYKAYMKDLGRLLLRDSGSNLTEVETDAKLQQFVDEAYAIEKQVAYAIKRTNKRWRYFGNFKTIGDLQDSYPQLHLSGLLLKSFRHAGATLATPVVIRYPNYLDQLNRHIRDEFIADNLTDTDKNRYWSNFITWTTLRQYGIWLSWEYRNKRYAYLEAASGRTRYMTTWYSCIGLVKSRFALGLAGIFVDQHLNALNKPQVQEMFDKFKVQLQRRIDEFDWMDEATKKLAKKKALLTQAHIGFPDILSDRSKLEEMYTHFNFSYNQGFFNNLLAANQFYQYILNHELVQGHQYTVWRYTLNRYGFGVRPSFWWIHNSLVVPPGSLMEPMYSPHSPSLIKYGKLGVYMASRMFHVLDIYGRWTYNGTFDYWWSSETNSNYTQAVDCITDYYANQTLGPYLINGENKTVQADSSSRLWRVLSNTGGLSLAYQAYKSEEGSHRKDVPMPNGYSLHSDQLFFLAAAQMRCYTQKETTAYNNAKRGKLPDKTLLNGMMSHTPEFLKSFQCSSKNSMYPQSQCKVY